MVVDGEGEATISAKDGTLQLKANVTPSTASNKSVTWSVDEPEIATISNTGLLTAKTNGTVTVTATAKDGSGEKGSLVVTVSGQEKTLSVATIGSLRIPATETIFAWANGYNHSVWNGLNVTGTLYKVPVETSTPAFGAESGETHFLPFAITAPEAVGEGATVKITGLKDKKESSFTYEKKHFETDKNVLQVLWAVEKGEDQLTIEVNWGTDYTSKTYILDLKGLTLSDNETPPLKVVSIEKSSAHITGDNKITVDAAGNVVTIGGKIPYQAESILGHAESSYLYEFKVTLDNLKKGTAACKTVGSITNTYAAGDNWLDGDDYFKFVGDASNRQNITITIDNDGNWETKDDQLTITVKVATDAQLGEDSTATITLDGETDHTNDKYGNTLTLGADLKVTGTLKYHETDPTGMGFADYDHYFLVFKIAELPETGATITVEGKANGSDSSTTYTLTGNSEVFIWGVEKDENIEITVDYGTGFVAKTYKLDLSGVTLNSAFNKVEVAKSDNHIKNANDTTVAIEGNTITIGGTIPWQEAGILGHDAGNLYELKFTFENINKETAACKTEGSQTNKYAAGEWLDGEKYVHYVGKADKKQDITISFDNDGNWETTEDQVSYTIKVAEGAVLVAEKDTVIGTHTVAIGDTAVPSFTRAADGTITVAKDAVGEDGKITGETVLTALNAQVPGTGGTAGIGYTGYKITLNGIEEGTKVSVKAWRNGEERNVTPDDNNYLSLYTAIADKDGDAWTARIDEETTWKLEWYDADNKLIGRTFFTTEVKMGE